MFLIWQLRVSEQDQAIHVRTLEEHLILCSDNKGNKKVQRSIAGNQPATPKAKKPHFERLLMCSFGLLKGLILPALKSEEREVCDC